MRGLCSRRELKHAFCVQRKNTFIPSIAWGEHFRPVNFGDRLNLALTIARKTRRDLAAQLCISEQAVGQVINGQTHAMSAENTARAARYLECSTYWLATGEEGPQQVRENVAPPYLRWPFRTVSHERVASLNDMQREMIEALLLKALNELQPTAPAEPSER